MGRSRTALRAHAGGSARLAATGLAGAITTPCAADRDGAMHHRRCGRGGLMLPAISLGGWEAFGAIGGRSPAQMALAWIPRLPSVASALIGASKVEQLDEDAKALDKLDFSPEEPAEIDRLTA